MTGRVRVGTLVGIAAMVAALALPVAASPSPSSPAHAKALAKSQELMAQGQFEEASKILRKAEKIPGEPPVQLLLDLAVCFNALGKPIDAEGYARRAVAAAVEPVEQALAYNHLGMSLTAQANQFFLSIRSEDEDFEEKLVEAQSAFRKVLEITNEQWSAAWYNLAESLKLSGRLQESRAALEAYLDRSPDGERAPHARSFLEWISCAQGVLNAASQERLYNAGGDVRLVGPIHVKQLPGNVSARTTRIKRTIRFEAIIDRSGAVKCLNLLDDLPPELAEPWLETLSHWTFDPPTLDGEPVVVRHNLVPAFPRH